MKFAKWTLLIAAFAFTTLVLIEAYRLNWIFSRLTFGAAKPTTTTKINVAATIAVWIVLLVVLVRAALARMRFRR